MATCTRWAALGFERQIVVYQLPWQLVLMFVLHCQDCFVHFNMAVPAAAYPELHPSEFDNHDMCSHSRALPTQYLTLCCWSACCIAFLQWPSLCSARLYSYLTWGWPFLQTCAWHLDFWFRCGKYTRAGTWASVRFLESPLTERKYAFLKNALDN